MRVTLYWLDLKINLKYSKGLQLSYVFKTQVNNYSKYYEKINNENL